MLLTEQAARLHDGDWAPFFAAECAKPYFAALDAFVTEAAHTTVYPAAENIFAAFGKVISPCCCIFYSGKNKKNDSHSSFYNLCVFLGQNLECTMKWSIRKNTGWQI